MEYDRTAEYPSAAVSRTSTCWPATWPGQSCNASASVRAVGVSSRSPTTLAVRQIDLSRGVSPFMFSIDVTTDSFPKNLVLSVGPWLVVTTCTSRPNRRSDNQKEHVLDGGQEFPPASPARKH